MKRKAPRGKDTEYGQVAKYLGNGGQKRINWTLPDLTTEQGKIQEEVAKKFRKTNRFGIAKFNYSPFPGDSFYSSPEDHTAPTQNTKYDPQLDLTAHRNTTGKAINSPDPSVLAHELIHANDHQHDNLNAKVWRHLGELGGNHNDFASFNNSLKKIQDKIDPTKVFSSQYPIDEEYIGTDMEPARTLYVIPNTQANSYSSTTPFLPTSNNKPDNTQLFKDINAVVTNGAFSRLDAKKPHTTQNPGMFLGRGSEFPAFISERLTQPWYTANDNKAAPRLNTPEARFTRNVLNDMSAAYPAGDYPTINTHIQNRVQSIEKARGYSLPLAKGGRVTNIQEKLSIRNPEDADIVDFIEANKKRRSQPRMPNLHHDAIKRGFTIASSDPKEINRLLELSENGTSKQFNDYLLSVGMANTPNKRPKNMLDKLLEQLDPPKYPKPKNKLEKIADDLGDAMNVGW